MKLVQTSIGRELTRYLDISKYFFVTTTTSRMINYFFEVTVSSS